MVCERPSWGVWTAGELDIIAGGSAAAALSVGPLCPGRDQAGLLCLHLCECRSVDMSVILLNPEVLEQCFKIFRGQRHLLETKSQGFFIQRRTTHLCTWEQTDDSVCKVRSSLGGPEAHPQTLSGE